MTDQPIQTYEENEISLLDILVTLAESWKLLVFGPLIVGVLAGGLSFLWPKTFESLAIVRMTEEEVAMLHTAPVLDPLIEKFGLLTEAGGVVVDARQRLRAKLIFTVDKKTKWIVITAKGRTPEEAQVLNQAAIGMLVKTLQPKGKQKKIIDNTIEINNKAIADGMDVIESIQKNLKKDSFNGLAQESALKYLVVVNSDISKRMQENEELMLRLNPKEEELLIEEASLPQRKISPNRGALVLVSMTAFGFVMITFILLRIFFIAKFQRPEVEKKLKAIKKYLVW